MDSRGQRYLGEVEPRKPNHKRKVAALPDADLRESLGLLAGRARYTGNPVHKRNPGDFGLKPPALARPGKTLCDGAEIFTRVEAERLLKAGLTKGLVSVAWRDGWPQNVWAVSMNGMPVEAMLEDPIRGAYHGYPMAESDPLAEVVLERWKA